MSILIVGSDGSMGKRYQSILRYLKKDFVCSERHWSQIADFEIPNRVTGIIIATPTNTHVQLIEKFLQYKKPILCEKPVTKNFIELRQLLGRIQDSKILFHMMYQYKNLVPEISMGDSRYDYFRHGNDGLIWDCLQIIGLSKSAPVLKEESPIWNCTINGHSLHLENMDEAYVKSVRNWLDGEEQDLDEIQAIHKKTWDMANAA